MPIGDNIDELLGVLAAPALSQATEQVGLRAPAPQPQPPLLDPRFSAGLHPEFSPRLAAFLAEARSLGLPLRATEGRRDRERQTQLYAQGRSTPGSIVTTVGPDDSAHVFGLAADVGFETDGGGVDWNENRPWEQVGELAKKHGLEWGGSWKGFVDRPHVQLSDWRTYRDGSGTSPRPSVAVTAAGQSALAGWPPSPAATDPLEAALQVTKSASTGSIYSSETGQFRMKHGLDDKQILTGLQFTPDQIALITDPKQNPDYKPGMFAKAIPSPDDPVLKLLTPTEDEPAWHAIARQAVANVLMGPGQAVEDVKGTLKRAKAHLVGTDAESLMADARARFSRLNYDQNWFGAEQGGVGEFVADAVMAAPVAAIAPWVATPAGTVGGAAGRHVAGQFLKSGVANAAIGALTAPPTTEGDPTNLTGDVGAAALMGGLAGAGTEAVGRGIVLPTAVRAGNAFAGYRRPALTTAENAVTAAEREAAARQTAATAQADAQARREWTGQDAIQSAAEQVPVARREAAEFAHGPMTKGLFDQVQSLAHETLPQVETRAGASAAAAEAAFDRGRAAALAAGADADAAAVGGETALLDFLEDLKQHGGDPAAVRLLGMVAREKGEYKKILQSSLNLEFYGKKLASDADYDLVREVMARHGEISEGLTPLRKAIDKLLKEEEASLVDNPELQRKLIQFRDRLAERTEAAGLERARAAGKPEPKPVTYDDLLRLRSMLGDKIDDFYKGRTAVTGTTEARAWQELKDATSDSMREAAEQVDGARQLQRIADRNYKINIAPYKDDLLAAAMKTDEPDQILQIFSALGADRAAKIFAKLGLKGKAAVQYGRAMEVLDEALDRKSMTLDVDKAFQLFEKGRKANDVYYKGEAGMLLGGFFNLVREVDRIEKIAEAAGEVLKGSKRAGSRASALAQEGVRDARAAATAAEEALAAEQVQGPLTGNLVRLARLVGATHGKLGAVLSKADPLFNTPWGQRLLFAANELPPGSRFWRAILTTAERGLPPVASIKSAERTSTE